MLLNRHELLVHALQLPASERVALAHDLLRSAAEGSISAGPADEVAEPVAQYDSAFRAKKGPGEASSEGLWEAIQTFRAEADLESLDAETAFANLRDRSPGREVVL